MWAQTYPRDEIPPTNLAVIYLYLGDYDEALARQKAFKLIPKAVISYSNLVGSYLNANRLDEARATAEEAQAHNLDNL